MKHLQHVEDLVLFGKGAEAIEMLRRFNHMHPNIKYDGSPAIFLGKKRDNTRFIATGGIFNKTPKYFTSIPEIRFGLRDPELQNKLVAVWNTCEFELKHVKPGEMHHGDFLFDPYSIKREGMGVTFQPNTIKYYTPDPKAKKAELGMAWHSKYIGDPETGWEVQYGLHKFPKINWMWEPKTHFELSDDFNYTQFNSVLGNAEDLLEEVSDTLWVHLNDKNITAFQRWYNEQLRSGKSIMDVVSWLCNKEVMMLLARLMNLPKTAERGLADLMMVMYFITDAKMMILHLLNTIHRGETYLTSKVTIHGSSNFPTGHEGIVLNSPEHKIVTKLVDRETFTVANFNAKRGWHRG